MLTTLITAALTALVTSFGTALGTRLENSLSGEFRAAGQTKALEALRADPQAAEAQKVAQRVIAEAAARDSSFRGGLQTELKTYHPDAWQHGQHIAQQLESRPDLRDQVVSGQVGLSSALQTLTSFMQKNFGWTDEQARLNANSSNCPRGGEPLNVFSVRYLRSDGSMAKHQTAWYLTSQRGPHFGVPEYPVCAQCPQGHIWQIFTDTPCPLVKRP